MVEEVRSWTLFEECTIGPAIVFLIGISFTCLIILSTEGPETLLLWLGSLADVVQLVFAVPLTLLTALVAFRWRRLRDERWVRDNTPILQRVLQMNEVIEPEWFRIPPRWVDFKEHVYRRHELNSLMERVQQNPVTIFHAMSGAGKSTLVLQMGYVLLTEERWRFVIYWDAGSLGFQDPEFLIREVHSHMTSLSLTHSKALVIIDNVHLATDLVGRCVRDLAGLFEGNIRCLLVARVTAESVTEDKKKWIQMLGLTNPALSRGPAKSCTDFFSLGPEDFGRSLEHITEFYAQSQEYLLPKNRRDCSLLFSVLRRKSKESLVLLKFLLESLKEEVCDIRKVEATDVVAAVREHYDAHVIARVVTRVKNAGAIVSDYRHLIQTIKIVLLCTSLYSGLEMPTYRSLLFDICGADRTGQEYVNRTLADLLSNGDLIGTEDRFSHPHLAIAGLLSDAYPDENSVLRGLLNRKIPRDVVGLVWPREYAVVALYIHLMNRDDSISAAAVLARLIDTDGMWLSDSLVGFLSSRPGELACALGTADRNSWNQDGTRFLLERLARDFSVHIESIVAEVIRSSGILSLIIETISSWPHMRSDRDVKAAILQAIRKSKQPLPAISVMTYWPELEQDAELKTTLRNAVLGAFDEHHTAEFVSSALHLMEGWPELRSEKRIMTAAVQVIRSSEEPWRIISDIAYWPEFRNDSEVAKAVMASAPRIVRAIRTSGEAEDIIEAIGGWPDLRTLPVVRKAVIEAVDNTNDPWSILSSVGGWPEARQDPAVVEAITRAVIESASSMEDPILLELYADSIFSPWPHLLHNPKIWMAVFRAASEASGTMFSLVRWVRSGLHSVQHEVIRTAIARAICSSDRPWYVIGMIDQWSEFAKDPAVLASLENTISKIIGALHSSEQPWDVIENISRCAKITENTEVGTAMKASIGLIVHGIRNSEESWGTVRELRNCPVVRRDADVRRAVKESARRIAHSFRESVQPWYDLYDIEMWPELRYDPEVEMALNDSIQKVADGIRFSGEDIEILELIADCDELRRNPDISRAIRDSVPKIIESIRWFEPLEYLRLLGNWSELRDDPEVYRFVKGMSLMAADFVRKSHAPWYAIWSLGANPALRESDDIRRAVDDAIPVISQSIRHSNQPWEIIDCIASWPEIWHDSSIVEAVEEAIPRIVETMRTAEEPWGIIICISSIQRLMEAESIQKAISEALPLLAHTIPKGVLECWDLETLLGIRMVRDHPDIRDALTAAGLYDRFYRKNPEQPSENVRPMESNN